MPSLAICSSNQLMPAPRPLSCQHKRSAILDVVSFRTVAVPSTGVIPSPFLRQEQHESRSPVGTRVVVDSCRLERFPALLSSSTSHRYEQLLLGSLALALMHVLLLRTPGLASAAQAKAKDYQPLAPPVTAVPPATGAHTNQPCARKN